MDIKLSIEMKLLSQFLNAKYLDYKIIDNNQLLCNELVFKYKKELKDGMIKHPKKVVENFVRFKQTCG